MKMKHISVKALFHVDFVSISLNDEVINFLHGLFFSCKERAEKSEGCTPITE